MKPAELLKLRQGLGYSQQKFADFIGVRKNTVWRWENGREAISHPWPDYIRLTLARGVEPARKSA